MNCARALALVLMVLVPGCSRRNAPEPPDGYWYPEQILTATERHDESTRKIALLTGWMRRNGHESLVISTPANFAWVTAGGDSRIRGFPCAQCCARLFFSRDGRKVLIAPPGEAVRIAREEVAGVDYELNEVAVCEAASGEGAALKLAGGKAPLDDAQDPALLSELRVPLSEPEMREYRWLGKRCGEVLDRVCRSIQPGMTERGIEALLSQGLRRHAITPVQILVAADERAKKYGAVPASEKTKVEESVVAGFSAARWGLVVSMARAVRFGPMPEETRKAAQAVSGVIAGYWARTLPGTPVASIAAAALQDYQRLGFPLAGIGALQGGATGYGRDWFACPGSQEVIRSGQTFAWNAFVSPVASEDTILVVGDQLEVLTEIRGWPAIESRALGRVYRTPGVLVKQEAGGRSQKAE